MNSKIEQISEAASTRREQWKAVAASEAQRLLTEAAKIHDLIKTAKTDTKRKYYQKKFKTIQTELFQMVTAQEYLKRSEEADAQQAAAEESTVTTQVEEVVNAN